MAEIINPTLEENIPIVVALMHSVHGENPGKLNAYKTYNLTDPGTGLNKSYILTHDILQFCKNNAITSDAPEICLDVVEPFPETAGGYGKLHNVPKSIIFVDGKPVFNGQEHHVVKELLIKHPPFSDKPGKPHHLVRDALREQYFASLHPTLGAHYQVIQEKEAAFIHMKRMPGRILNHYTNLTAEEFLSLACTLLEEAPKQIHRTIEYGKHAGRVPVHCDLKLNNIMAIHQNGKWTINVLDMGLAKPMTNGIYEAKRRRGNFYVTDSEMLKAYGEKRPTVYSEYTDTYALFVIIWQLAGVSVRRKIERQKLLADLESPNLSGLGQNMNFDSDSLKELHQLALDTLSDNRRVRLSRADALARLKSLLVKIRFNNTPKATPAALLLAADPEGYSAQDLINIVQEMLDDNIYNDEILGTDKALTIRSWISQYRLVHSKLSPEELEKFERKIANNKVIINSDYIITFLLHPELNTYDAISCARLLVRHHQLTYLLRTDYELPEDWASYFNYLLQSMPLQLSTDDTFSTEAGLFKRHIAEFLISERHSCSTERPIRDMLMVYLNNQFGKTFDQWKTDLPEMMRSFNQRYLFLNQLVLIKQKYENYEFFITEELNKWAAQIESDLQNSELPADLEDRLILREQLINLLSKMRAISNHVICNFFRKYPFLGDAVFNRLEQNIKTLEFNKEHSVNALVKKLELFILLKNIYLALKDSDYFSQLYDGFDKRFVTILKGPESEMAEKAAQLSSDINIIKKLDDYMSELERYVFSITIALLCKVINNISIAARLVVIIDNNHEWNYFKKLDKAMEYLFAQFDQTDIEAQLIKEFERYYAAPSLYTPPAYSVNNYQTLFAIPSNTGFNNLTESTSKQLRFL